MAKKNVFRFLLLSVEEYEPNLNNSEFTCKGSVLYAEVVE